MKPEYAASDFSGGAVVDKSDSRTPKLNIYKTDHREYNGRER